MVLLRVAVVGILKHCIQLMWLFWLHRLLWFQRRRWLLLPIKLETNPLTQSLSPGTALSLLACKPATTPRPQRRQSRTAPPRLLRGRGRGNRRRSRWDFRRLMMMRNVLLGRRRRPQHLLRMVSSARRRRASHWLMMVRSARRR